MSDHEPYVVLLRGQEVLTTHRFREAQEDAIKHFRTGARVELRQGVRRLRRWNTREATR